MHTIFTEAREDLDFPDEIETPVDVPAREFFKDYRGLESFRGSPWDINDNLPAEYSQILHLHKFHHFCRKQLKEESEECIPVSLIIIIDLEWIIVIFVFQSGSYVSIKLKNVQQHCFDQLTKSKSPLVAFSLLKHEQKMSVVNFIFKSRFNRPIQNGEKIIVHAGIVRFECNALFSEHTSNNKFKVSFSLFNLQ